MLHHYVKDDSSGDHWAVNSSTFFLPGARPHVLTQLQAGGEQVRLALSADQAENMAAALLEHAAKVRQAAPTHLDWSEAEIATLDGPAQDRYREAKRIQEGATPV